MVDNIAKQAGYADGQLAVSVTKAIQAIHNMDEAYRANLLAKLAGMLGVEVEDLNLQEGKPIATAATAEQIDGLTSNARVTGGIGASANVV